MNFQLYSDPEKLFHLKIPSDWLAETANRFGVRIAFLSTEAAQGFHANVNVIVNEVPPLTTEEFLTLSRLQLKQLSGLVTLPVDKQIAHPNSAQAHLFEWTNPRAPNLLTMWQLVVFAASKALILTATALAESFDKYRHTFETIFRSFEPGQLDQVSGTEE